MTAAAAERRDRRIEASVTKGQMSACVRGIGGTFARDPGQFAAEVARVVVEQMGG